LCWRKRPRIASNAPSLFSITRELKFFSYFTLIDRLQVFVMLVIYNQVSQLWTSLFPSAISGLSTLSGSLKRIDVSNNKSS
jgi:hypothetical protein